MNNYNGERICEDLFYRLAKNSPEELVTLIKEYPLDDVDLSFAAEALGRTPPSVALPVLLSLVHHKDAVVREGAVHGLASFIHYSSNIQEELRNVVRHDPSIGVRSAAVDALMLVE